MVYERVKKYHSMRRLDRNVHSAHLRQTLD
jgi:hypothetical protein